MSVAATQHEIAVARVMAHMEIHISDLLCLARHSTRRESLGSAPDIKILLRGNKAPTGTRSSDFRATLRVAAGPDYLPPDSGRPLRPAALLRQQPHDVLALARRVAVFRRPLAVRG